MSNVISIALDCILFICFVICMMGRRPIVLNKILSLSLSLPLPYAQVDRINRIGYIKCDLALE